MSEDKDALDFDLEDGNPDGLESLTAEQIAEESHSYGEVTLDRQLIDPTNNAAIARIFPDAPAGSADAKKLIFTNAASQTGRENVSARVSCDDGRTWPGFRTISRASPPTRW